MSLAAVLFAAATWNAETLHGQQDSAATIEAGDRVRVWQPQAGIRGEEFTLESWTDDSLVVLSSGSGAATHLSKRNIEQLKKRRAEGSHLWDGVLIGSGVGLVADAVWTTALCSSIDHAIHVSCVTYAPMFLSVVTVLPGAIAGGLIGATVENYEWISVDIGPAVGPATSRPATGAGVSARVELRLEALP
ncbi:MAG: hypothetical protein Q8W44_02040 [Candidatus Palauibacterales bacterium]|nr:hypothetical protein [Candidatus Palauibacterales bacterium]